MSSVYYISLKQAAQFTGGLFIYRSEDEKPVAVIWKKKALKPFVSYRFKDVKERELYIRHILDAEAKRQREKQEIREARKPTQEQIDSVRVGDIFVDTWGYDQTNVDFYQIVEKKGRAVMVRPIAARSVKGSEGFMSDRRVAVPGNFKGEAAKKILGFSNGQAHLPSKYGWCGKWSGSAMSCTWYA